MHCQPPRPPRRQSGGFTLLEIMVALAIFSVIGIASYRMLDTVIDTRERLTVVNERSERLGRVLLRMERDLRQFYPRAIRNEFGDPAPSLMVETGPYPLEFTRLGWRNPGGNRRSELQRVAYRIHEDKLQRLFWRVLDRAEDSLPFEQTLLEGVDHLRIEVFDQTGRSADSWPLDQDATGGGTNGGTVPVALEVTFSGQAIGELRRYVPLVAAASASIAADANAGGESGPNGNSGSNGSNNSGNGASSP